MTVQTSPDLPRVRRSDVQRLIRMRAPFNSNDTMTGTLLRDDGAFPSLGMLPARWAAELSEAWWHGRLFYVVHSYATPVMWCVAWPGAVREVMPTVRYSLTTTQHQYEVINGMVFPPRTMPYHWPRASTMRGRNPRSPFGPQRGGW